jgi:hypothetical protein
MGAPKAGPGMTARGTPPIVSFFGSPGGAPLTVTEAVWTQHTEDGSGGRAVVRWYELPPATLTTRQEGMSHNPANSVFNGAVSPAATGERRAQRPDRRTPPMNVARYCHTDRRTAQRDFRS